MSAAQAAECGRAFGRFWQVHDVLFRAEKLTEALLRSLPNQLGDLNSRDFLSCFDADSQDGKSAVVRVRSDMDAARRLKTSGTPTLFLGLTQRDGSLAIRRRLTGAVPAPALLRLIDELRATAN
jgi:protein-disulfide isomerase